VIAGAGSGKTRVLTRRVAYILRERRAEPYQILAVTFTNKAAGEMKDRVTELLGGQPFDLNVSTFHSFCARLLRREADAIGYDKQFTIFDQEDSRTLAKNCVKELGFAENQFHPRAQLRKISDAKNSLLSAEQFAASAQGYFETRTAQIYTLYQRRLREYNAMDFDDLLFNAVMLLKDSPTIGEKYRRRFRYLLVDEYQDTNHAQYLLLKYLLGEHQNICVVGDEDQSIYGWRGADIRNILEFEKDFPGATIIKLEENFRSTEIILKAASAVIGNNQARKGKTLWTSRPGGDRLDVWLVNSAEDEALEVVREIERARTDVPLNEMVVLYRTNAQSRAFEEQLRRAGIAYQIVGGVSFYQRKEIKDLLGGCVVLSAQRNQGPAGISEADRQPEGRHLVSPHHQLSQTRYRPEDDRRPDGAGTRGRRIALRSHAASVRLSTAGQQSEADAAVCRAHRVAARTGRNRHGGYPHSGSGRGSQFPRRVACRR
jgi:DNA helicase-2/ATP-dependent DNA helicase PcrA